MKRSNLVSLLVAVLVVALVSTVAFAGVSGSKKDAKGLERAQKAFSLFDANNDGNVTLAEFSAKAKDEKAKQRAAVSFSKMDSNEDALVAFSEFYADQQRKENEKATSASSLESIFENEMANYVPESPEEFQDHHAGARECVSLERRPLSTTMAERILLDQWDVSPDDQLADSWIKSRERLTVG